VSGTNHTTTYSYADSYTTLSGGSNVIYTPAVNTNAYLTTITDPLGHTANFTYDFHNGQLTISKDANTQRTTVLYNDSFARPTQINYPDGGQTEHAYNDAPFSPSVTTCQLINGTAGATCSPTSPPSGWKTSVAVMDGIGRVVQTALVSDPSGTDYTVTAYDGLGRLYQKYNPTRCSPPATNCGESTWGYTTTNYDSLNRATSVVEQDGSTVNMSYAGNCITSTDEAGKARKSCADGLGRMTGVWEDSSGLNYETDYVYNALGNLTNVNQKGSNSANARTRTFQYDSLSRLTSATNPESGTITYTYDANGNVVTKTAPAPNQTGTATVTTTYYYDALNRLGEKTYSDGTPWAWYGYDVAPGFMTDLKNVVGRLANSTNPYGGQPSSTQATATTYSYDAMGRVIREWDQTPSISPGGYFTYSSYDLAGNLTSINDTGAGTTISYGPYNGASRLTTIKSSLNDAQHPGTLWSAGTYYPHGAVETSTFGNGLIESRDYEPRLQLCQLNLGTFNAVTSNCSVAPPNGLIEHYQYVYGNWGSTDNGNITGWGASGVQNFNRNYSYDALNRLQSMTDSATNQPCQGMSWTIDAWGNMTNQTGTNGTCYSFSSSVGTNNQLIGYQYDAAGNMTFDGSHHYTYDAENRITQVDSGSTASYVYNENGQRVRKNTGTGWTEYFYGPNGSVQSEYNGSSWPVQYVYAGSQLIAEYTNGTTEFVHSDHLGSTRMVTGVNQSVVDNLDYLPFGQQIAGGTSTTHKFTGKERDTESNLDNFGARYFTSNMGRFMTPDWATRPTAVPYALFGDPQSLNLYTYVRNDPVTRADADGHCWMKLFRICSTGSMNAQANTDEAQNTIDTKPPTPAVPPQAFDDAHVNDLTVRQVANVVANENNSVTPGTSSPETLQQAKTEQANAVMNADYTYGANRQNVTHTAPDTVSPQLANSPQYQQALQAARTAFQQQNLGTDPTGNRVYFNNKFEYDNKTQRVINGHTQTVFHLFGPFSVGGGRVWTAIFNPFQ